MMETKNEPKQTKSNDLTLTRKQKEAIPHLVGARSLEEGCRSARLSKSTLYAWFRNKTFKDELNSTRERVIEEAIQRLKTGVTQAVDRLLELVEDKEKEIRLRACEKVLDFFLRVKEMDELEGRLQSIEQIILERKIFK